MMKPTLTTVTILSSLALVVTASLPAAYANDDNDSLPSWAQAAHNESPSAPELAQEAPVEGRSEVTVLSVENGNPVLHKKSVGSRAEAEQVIGEAQRQPDTVAASVNGTASIADAPVDPTDPPASDPERSKQWGMDWLGAEKVWPHATGRNITVAVIDTGVNVSHPDLQGQLLPGADLVNGDLTNFEPVTGDGHGHGTHVSGIIAGVAGNGEGIAGFAPHAQILPVAVLGEGGTGPNSDVVEGILYAAQQNVDVINLSVGTTENDPVMKAAIDRARESGATIVAAAGNSGPTGKPLYPAAFDGVVGVGAIDQTGSRANFSTPGEHVDVAAPGAGILSTYKNTYSPMSGTSMATPFVSGLAAMLREANPGLTATMVEDAMTSTASLEEARTNELGSGVIQPLKAMCTVIAC